MLRKEYDTGLLAESLRTVSCLKLMGACSGPGSSVCPGGFVRRIFVRGDFVRVVVFRGDIVLMPFVLPPLLL